MNIEDLNEQETIELSNKQVKKFIKYKKLYDGLAEDVKAVGLTEGWIELHAHLPKEYKGKKIYNAIARGCEKFLKNELDGLSLTRTQRAKFHKIEDRIVNIDELKPQDALRRTEWGLKDVKTQNLYYTMGLKMDVFKGVFCSLKRHDRVIALKLYGDVYRGIRNKRYTYSKVASELSLCTETIARSHDRIKEAFRGI